MKIDGIKNSGALLAWDEYLPEEEGMYILRRQPHENKQGTKSKKGHDSLRIAEPRRCKTASLDEVAETHEEKGRLVTQRYDGYAASRSYLQNRL